MSVRLARLLVDGRRHLAVVAVDPAVDDLPSAPPRVVLTERFWRNRLLSDPQIVGKSLTLDGIPHTVVGIAATKDEAVRMASEKEPGLVLADIRLHDGSSGVEAVQEILSAMKVPVVFITAYPEYLLTGERPEPTFLVTKPFKNETVVVTVSQAMLSAEAR